MPSEEGLAAHTTNSQEEAAATYSKCDSTELHFIPSKNCSPKNKSRDRQQQIYDNPHLSASEKKNFDIIFRQSNGVSPILTQDSFMGGANGIESLQFSVRSTEINYPVAAAVTQA